MKELSGKIIGITEKEIRPRQGGKQFDPFTIYTYFVQDADGGRPEELESSLNSRKIGDKVKIPFYIRTWASGNRHGHQIREIEEK